MIDMDESLNNFFYIHHKSAELNSAIALIAYINGALRCIGSSLLGFNNLMKLSPLKNISKLVKVLSRTLYIITLMCFHITQFAIIFKALLCFGIFLCVNKTKNIQKKKPFHELALLYIIYPTYS